MLAPFLNAVGRRKALATGITMISIAGCSVELAAPSSDGALHVASAKAVATSDMSVTSAVPDSATQDTTISVTINGSGFVPGTVATWALGGVMDSLQVRTNSTQYVNQKKLIANITISAGATVGDWDIIVAASGKKGGIGTEKFQIKLKPYVDADSRVFVEWDSLVDVAAPGSAPRVVPAGIQGDGRDRFGNSAAASEYQGDFCGTRAKLYGSSSSETASGDLVIAPSLDYKAPMQTACGSKRALKFFLSYKADGATGPAILLTDVSTNARAAHQMTAGETRLRKLAFTITQKDCERVIFDTELGNGTSYARVSRLADAADGSRRWRVSSEYPHVAMCVTYRGQQTVPRTTRYLPFAYTATEVRYPYPVYR